MYVILALLLLGVLILAHEAGHYLAARACGIEVQEFAMGMGPLLCKWKNKHGTRFSIRLLPIGGFCQFYGEDEDVSDPRAFNNQSVYKRLATVVSGPMMNFVVAFVVVVLYLSALGILTTVPRVAQVEEHAAKAGLMAGDTLLYVNDIKAESSSAVLSEIMKSAGETVTLRVERSGKEVEIPIAPFYDEEVSRYRVGFTFAQERQRVSLAQSIPFSVRYNAESVQLIGMTL